jgi:hypothetical protein
VDEGEMKKILFLILAGFIFYGCDVSPCETDVIQKVDSPNKALQAIVFQRTCGATTGFNRQIVVIESGKPLSKSDDWKSFFAMDGDTKIEVIWQSETNLLVRYTTTENINRASQQAGKIRVTYEVLKN